MKPILSLCLLMFALHAGAKEMVCPKKFPVEAIKLSPLPKGWIGIAPSVLRLTMIDFMYGPPVEPGARLMGDARKIRNGSEVAYDLSTPDPEGKWQVCRYGALALAQRIPDETESCVVRYINQPEFPGNYDIQVSCRANGGESATARRKP